MSALVKQKFGSRRLFRTLFGGMVLIALGYVATVLLEKRNLESIGAKLVTAAISTQSGASALPVGSVLVLGTDTVADLVSEARAVDPKSGDEYTLIAARALPAGELGLSKLDGYAARKQAPEADGREVFVLVPMGEKRGVASRSTLVVRASRDSTRLRTFEIF